MSDSLLEERNEIIRVGEELAYAAWEAYMEGEPALLEEFERRYEAWERLMGPYREEV